MPFDSRLFVCPLDVLNVLNCRQPVISANVLDYNLKLINRRACQSKMECHTDPNPQATAPLISCKIDSPNHPSLFCNGNVVSTVNEQKHLGLILDSKLSFERHLNEKKHLDKKSI